MKQTYCSVKVYTGRMISDVDEVGKDPQLALRVNVQKSYTNSTYGWMDFIFLAEKTTQGWRLLPDQRWQRILAACQTGLQKRQR
jgi:hypothetical protein